MVILLLGEDNLSKQAKLAKIKEECLSGKLKEFNTDTFYGHELNLKTLQEKLLFFPLQSARRILVIKEAQKLKKEVKDFISDYAGKSDPRLVLILDFSQGYYRDEFVNGLIKHSRVFRFKENIPPDTFALNRQIEYRRTTEALSILRQLLDRGEKPEFILGGLRYVWERRLVLKNPPELKKRMSLLLNSDIAIKTGKIKPEFVLERLVISCCLDKR